MELGQPPAALAEIAEQLVQEPGVRGVFWGRRRRSGRWLREAGIVIHVEKKRDVPAARMLPRTLGGEKVDVIETGPLRLFTILDHGDLALHAEASDKRESTPTAVSSSAQQAKVLLSGHGTLPLDGSGRIRRVFNSNAPICIRDSTAPYEVLTGSIYAGRFGESDQDWAVARFVLPAGARLREGHSGAFGGARVRVRARPLRAKDAVRHYSSLRGRWVNGAVQQVYGSAVSFDAPDGTRASYWALAAVTSPHGGPFSLPGDSGSLVFAAKGARTAVGVVVGGNVSTGWSYVLPLDGLRSARPDVYGQFFR